MKTKTLFKSIFAAMLIMAFISCKKSDTAKQAGTIAGTWGTTIWGGSNGDIMNFVINSAGTTGNITQLGTPTFGFSVGDVIYASIAATGTGTYSSTGTYHYGPNGQSMGQASATLTLQNNNTVLYVHYAQDASTGITPPDYYYQKQ
jgi:hypothetical protein